jgi:8-oxo-dGTP pyrophosphatase MutT (NUDIX family)
MIEDRSYGVFVVLRGMEDRFLSLHQWQGHWGFPKGHLEGNETIQEAALRELKEEAGITECTFPDLPLLTEEYIYVGEDKETYHKIVQYFIGFVESDVVITQKDEIQDHKWVTYDEALALLTYDNNKEILKKAKEYLDQYDPKK